MRCSRIPKCLMSNCVKIQIFLLLIILQEPAGAEFRFSISPVALSNTSIVPSPRADHLTVVIQSRDGFLVLIFGGRGKTGAKSDTWTYLVSENRWILLAAPALAETYPPPAMYGAVGGYRFLDNQMEFPFMYVTLGRLDNGTVTNEMWVMELGTFTWGKVTLDGDIPAPRWGALGSLERFVKPDGSVEPALIISHGHGEDGPLSDTYKCSFHSKDPYRATWKRIHQPVGRYSTHAPHPVWLHGGTFTPARDLVMFGGCSSSEKYGGICPSRDTWLLEYDPEETSDDETIDAEASAEPLSQLVPGTETVRWQRFPQGPAPRVGAAMAQGLNSFEGAYSGQRDIAVLYSGSQRTDDLPSDQVISMPYFDGGVLDIVSASSKSWLRERVHYIGPRTQRQRSLNRRKGATLSIVRDVSSNEVAADVPREYYLLFGGEFEDGSFTNELLKLSFDAFVESELITDRAMYMTRPMVHGSLMFLSWGVLMVIGVFSSRFMRDQQGRSRHLSLHICIQLLAVALAWTGAGIVIYGRRRIASSLVHGKIGLLLLFLASLQPLVAVIGVLAQLNNVPSHAQAKVKSKEPWIPWICLLYHRSVGLLVIVLGAVNITFGLFLFVAPTILWVHWIVYISLIFIAGVLLEVIGVQRTASEQMDARASSINPGGISQGSSYLSRMVHSLRGESTINILRRTAPTAKNKETALGDIPAESLDSSDNAPLNGSQSSSPSSHLIQESSTERIDDELQSQQLAELGVRVQSRGARQYSMRERLDSEASSISTYWDPDFY